MTRPASTNAARRRRGQRRLSVWLSAEAYAVLEALARGQGVTLSDVVRILAEGAR